MMNLIYFICTKEGTQSFQSLSFFPLSIVPAWRLASLTSSRYDLLDLPRRLLSLGLQSDPTSIHLIALLCLVCSYIWSHAHSIPNLLTASLPVFGFHWTYFVSDLFFPPHTSLYFFLRIHIPIPWHFLLYGFKVSSKNIFKSIGEVHHLWIPLDVSKGVVNILLIFISIF